MESHTSRHPSVPYILPFAVFLLFLAAGNFLPFGPAWDYPARVIVVGTLLLLASWRVIRLRPDRATQSALVGMGVFVLWIGPDLLWPGYRGHWLFSNPLTGIVGSTLSEDVRQNLPFLVFRIAGTAILVPVIEELFWRAWLMRYLISPHFQTVRLGTYGPTSFWVTAALFAVEHGPYWDVGFMAGIAYGWWMIRTKSLADCILAHAVTNLSLAVYVILGGRWEFWL